MGYVACISDAERWVWDLWAETPLEAPQVIYKAACVDFKTQQPLERTTNVPVSAGGHEQGPINMQGLELRV